jgi:hypothetical protein
MHSNIEDALKALQQSPEADFFSKKEYKSKKDIIIAVSQYHKDCHCAFKVVSSGKRRYKASCVCG